MFFLELLTKHLPLFVMFFLGGVTISNIATGYHGAYGIILLVPGTLYFALLYLYSKAAKKEIVPLFRVTLVGAIIIAVGAYAFVKASKIHYLYGAYVVAFICLWFLSHKKWI